MLGHCSVSEAQSPANRGVAPHGSSPCLTPALPLSLPQEEMKAILLLGMELASFCVFFFFSFQKEFKS